MPTDYGTTISRNLRRILYERDVSAAEMSRALRISKSTISGWMNGARVPRGKYIDMVCDFLHVSRSELVEEQSLIKDPEEPIKVKVYGRVAAGIPMSMIEDITGEEEIPASMGRGGKEYFALTIRGDSMSPRMQEGDIVIVRKQPDAESGDVVIVTVNSEDATCKRLRKLDNGIMLIPNNHNYEPMFYTNEQVKRLPIVILGVVVELRGKP